MKIRPRPVFIIVPLLYLLLGFLFLFQHIRNTETFSTVVSGIDLTGTRTLQTQLNNPSIRNIRLTYNGLSLPLRSGSVVIVTADGIHHKLPISSYRVDGQEVRIIFKYNIILKFYTDPHSQKITLVPEIPALIPAVKSIIIPISLDRKTVLETTEAGQILLKTPDGHIYYLKHPSDTIVDFKRGRMKIHVQETLEKAIVLSPEAGKGRTAFMWYEQEGKTISSTLFNETTQLYTDIAFAGWQRRLNPKTGQWGLPEGKAYYSEKAINAFLAESLVRGVYGKNWLTLTTAFESGTGDLTLESAPFMGDIVSKTDQFWGPVTQKTRQIRSDIENGNRDILMEPALTGYLEDFGLYGLREAFSEMLMATTPDMDLLVMARTLHHITDLQEAGFRTDGQAEIIERLVEKGILPGIFWLGDGLYIFSAGGKADIRNTIYIGFVLTRIARLESNEKYMAIGRKMILSALKLNDELGILPETVSFNGNDMKERTGAIPPEEIYPWIRENPYYPRRVSLARAIDRNSWLLTSAALPKINHTPTETSVTFQYPRGDVHHLVLKGIRPFQEIQMHGIRWNTDRRFQYYSDGWSYDEDTRTLYFKITHRNETEVIRILY